MTRPLDEIGFYTMTDARARRASALSPLQRCELLITDACNFKCPYCRGCKEEYRGLIPTAEWQRILSLWLAEGMRHARFSGGEPTLHPELADMVAFCRAGGVRRVALSTNGSAPRDTYERLLSAGVDDFSISLDACCASTGDTMAGGIPGAWERVVETIRWLATRVHVSVGVVLTDANEHDTTATVKFAHDLGVRDIRIIPAAQRDGHVALGQLSPAVLAQHPNLKFRVDRLVQGKALRGLASNDNNRCPLVLDDMAVVGGYHFPCIVYLREGGQPIGRVTNRNAMRLSRAHWAQTHDTHADPICSKNCLDFCIAYNNRWREFHPVA